MLFYLLSYPIIGAGIKIMDAAFDDDSVSKKLTIIIAPVIAILGAYAYLSVGFYSDIKMGFRRQVNIRNTLSSIVLIFK